jgi:hypothetical protein
LKNQEKAILDFRKAIEVFDKNKDNEGFFGVSVIYLVTIYEELKNYAQAESVLNKSIEIYPTSDNFLGRGNYYQRNNSTEKAIQDYKKAIELKNLKNVDDYIGLSTIFEKIKDYRSSLDTLNKAIEVYPNSAGAYLARGGFYRFKLNNIEQAVADYKKGAEVAPDSDPSKKYCIDQITEIENERASEAAYTAAQKEEKERKRRENTQAILNVMQGITQAITKTPSPQTTTTTQTNNSGGQTSSTNGSSGGQSNQTNNTSGQTSSNPSAGNGSTGQCGGNMVKQAGSSPNDCHNWLAGAVTTEDKYSGWDNCSVDDLQIKHCWGAWQQTIPQVQARSVGPNFDRARNSNGKPSYHWGIGFRNNSNTIIRFMLKLTYGDGSKQGGDDFRMYTLGPGQEIALHSEPFYTASNASTINVQLTQHEICTDISRTTVDGKTGWKCNLK